MNPWMIVTIVVLVGLGIYEFQAWGRRNQAIKDFEGKGKVTLYRKNGMEDTYIMELSGAYLKFPQETGVAKPDKGEYIIEENAMSTCLWPPNANKFSQVLLKCLSYDEGIANPRKRPTEKDIVDQAKVLSQQLRFARETAFFDFAARLGNNINDLIDAIKHPKPAMLMLILSIITLLGVGVNIYLQLKGGG
jgi:hypothetical protein